MKSPRALLAFLAVWLAVGAAASAQTVASVPTPSKDEAIVLSPFEVSASSDVGYQAR